MKKQLLLLLLFFAGISTSMANAGIFSKSFKKGTPVHITNNRDKGFAIKLNCTDEGMVAGSGNSTYSEEEIWYLVGDENGFKMYNKVAGKKYALKLDGNENGSAATLAKEKYATILTLTKKESGSYTISPKENPEMSFNMFGGAGRDIKLYSSSDKGGEWNFSVIDTKRPLTFKYEAQLDGGFDTNTRIGNIAITINGATSNIMLTKENLPKSGKCYLPEGATFSISKGLVCHGWDIDINNGSEIKEQQLPQDGMEVSIAITTDKENKFQYLFYSPDEKGVPYRIPAIATTANGYVFAINDYRPCGNDIGFGEVDLVMRHSTKSGKEWDGHSWSEPVMIADGVGKAAKETWLTGFGDPAIVADCESNEILVMSVCGNRLCWHGNYGAGTAENPENPNRISRLTIKYNEETGEWVAGKPQEVTYDIYPLFKDNEGKAHVGSMFIGAGRIAQSKKIKVGTHYRIYCAVWAVATGSGRHHNYAIYSDDFGKTWNLLGELGKDHTESPAPFGNEPKCEELPDGSVLLSSRKGYGRYFNVFHYTDIEKGKGKWDGVVSTDAVGNLKWGANDTNGEPLRIGNVLFQSAPTGNSRSNVSVFYKVLSSDPSTYTPAELSNGWTEIKISKTGSAYSSMCILPDGESIGLYYEEEPGGYSMVYVPLKLKELLPSEVYKELFK